MHLKPANPEFELPVDMNCHIWHYMTMRKFQSMLDNSAIYLCRGDRLEEKFEGTYSREQVHGVNEHLSRIGHPELKDTEQERRRHDKRRTYINCWCIAQCDLDLMWKRYVGNQTLGIAVRSSPQRLHDLCETHDLQPVGITKIKFLSVNNVYLARHFSKANDRRGEHVQSQV